MSLFYETYITQVTLVALDLLLNHIWVYDILRLYI